MILGSYVCLRSSGYLRNTTLLWPVAQRPRTLSRLCIATMEHADSPNLRIIQFLKLHLHSIRHLPRSPPSTHRSRDPLLPRYCVTVSVAQSERGQGDGRKREDENRNQRTIQRKRMGERILRTVYLQ